VKPAFRGYAPMLTKVAQRPKNVTYVNISPAPWTWPTVEAQGFRAYCRGLFFSFPALSRRAKGMRVEIVPRDAKEVDGLTQADVAILTRHAAYGCLGIVCHAADGRGFPFVLQPMRIKGRITSLAMQLMYCRDVADYVACAGAIGRFLLRRRTITVTVDANGRMNDLVGFRIDRQRRKYFKGPQCPRLADLSDTELVIYGRNSVAHAEGRHASQEQIRQPLADMDLLPGPMARGQCADHGATHPWALARLDRVRWRARFRRRYARPRHVAGLAHEGIARFPANAEIYIRPMYWPQNGIGDGVLFNPETTDWCVCIYEAPIPKPVGSAITLSPFRRPTAECAPVGAKAACLYPNCSRALNCLMLDMLGNVAEFGNSNVFMTKDGVVYTPVPNGNFLNGITRQRVIEILRNDGHTALC
jgi:hypothetical protein